MALSSPSHTMLRVFSMELPWPFMTTRIRWSMLHILTVPDMVSSKCGMHMATRLTGVSMRKGNVKGFVASSKTIACD